MIDLWDNEEYKKAIIKSQKKEYFRVFFLNYLYYNITEGLSRKIKINDISTFFSEIYSRFKKDEELNDRNINFSEYAVFSGMEDEVDSKKCEETKELANNLQKNDKYSTMFHLSDDYIIIDDGFSYSPTNAKTNGEMEGYLESLKKCFFSTEKELHNRWFRRDIRIEDKKIYSFIEKHITSYDKSVMQIICKSIIHNYSTTPKISPQSEGIIISSENYEMGKLLAARFIYRCYKSFYRNNGISLSEIVNDLNFTGELRDKFDNFRNDTNSKYLDLARRFAFLIQTCQPGHRAFNAKYEKKPNHDYPDRRPDADEAFQIARRNYILDNIGKYYQRFKIDKDEEGNILFQDAGFDDGYFPWVNINTMPEDDKKFLFRAKTSLDKILLEKQQAHLKKQEIIKKYQTIYQEYLKELSDNRTMVKSLNF